MSNFASAFKAETSRIARKETSNDIKSLRSVQSQHRSALAALKRRIEQLERQLKNLSRQAGRGKPAESPAESAGENLRFSAKGLATHRKRLGLSAAAAGALIGVSGLTIYNWEGGKSRPRPSQLTAIAAFRKLGKREATARLEQLQGS